MNTVKIYKRTCTKGYMMDEQGETYSLTPWGDDTPYYTGYDDGGEDYILPDNYELGETTSGEKAIFGPDGAYCDIYMHSSGLPQLISALRNAPVLKLS